jgi:tetratricopeptide (TPR) repeat protein
VASQPVEVFFSYSHKDEKLLGKLRDHLSNLKRLGVIADWYDRKIGAGREWENAIDEHLDSAGVILLLISSSFMASDYCNDVEVRRAMERHEAGEARVVPVLLRPCDWDGAPFSKLNALPTGAKPVTDWADRDKAFTDVAKGIRAAVEELRSGRGTPPESPDEAAKPSRPVLIPRPPFIGFVARRDAQGRDIVGRLKEELAPGRNQPVTLSGPGGIGKTTLAAEAARSLQETYEGRVVWSSADGRTDFALLSLLDDISTQLGRADLRTLAPAFKEEQVRSLIAEAPTLVVLDNYETIAAEEKKRIEAWFKSARCSTLFTSRPRVAGTVFVPVSAMSREEAEEFLERLAAQTQDAQIFTPDVRRRVYETAEANPFVMQWVVGQIDDAQEPDVVLKELAQGQGDAAERIFERSFNLLDGDGRDALLALSLFAPSATRNALSAAAGFDDEARVREAVKNLNRLWLIKLMDEHRHLAVEGLTRSMAAARLSKDPRAGEFRRRFVAYFLRFAREYVEPTPENYDALEVEKDNLLSAAESAFASKDWVSVMGMAYALTKPPDRVLYVRGYWGEAVRLGEQALQAARSSQDEARIAGLSHNLAAMYQNRGELDEARRLYGESLEIEKRLGNQSGVASTLHELGRLAQGQGELEEARRLYDESLEIEKRLGNQSGVASTTSQIGTVLFAQGEIEESKVKHQESLAIRRKLGEQQGIAIDLHQLAMLAQEQGELEEARRLYGESFEINKRLGDQGGVAITLHNLGRLAQGQGELEEARRLYGESFEITKRLGNQSVAAATLHELGRLAQTQGELEEARCFYDESLEIRKRLGDQGGIAATLHNLGMIAENKGDKAGAARLFREALSIFERLGSPDAELARRSLARVEGESSGR